MENITPNKSRQEWLDQSIVLLMAEFRAEGLDLPKYRATIGLPSSGAFGAKKRTIGQCFYKECSTDGTTEIMISPTQDVPLEILEVTLHECCHAVLGAGYGHGKEFRALATACGLIGKMTATKAGPEFIRRTEHILKTLGPIDHKKLDITIGAKKQSTRMVKVTCDHPDCGMVYRTSNKWIAESLGQLDCPICGSECSHG
tara:strand:+ start:1904 stop:2503 length:600 start_codon:yes stop_codon:yes gene_type:complete